MFKLQFSPIYSHSTRHMAMNQRDFAASKKLTELTCKFVRECHVVWELIGRQEILLYGATIAFAEWVGGFRFYIEVSRVGGWYIFGFKFLQEFLQGNSLGSSLCWLFWLRIWWFWVETWIHTSLLHCFCLNFYSNSQISLQTI